MSNNRISLRSRVWRCVRDLGKAGATTQQVQARLQDIAEGYVAQLLGILKDGGYVKHGGRGKPYWVDEDCRVPAGESPALGPGWDEADDQSLAQQVIGHTLATTDVTLVAASPTRAAPKVEGTGIRLPPKRQAASRAEAVATQLCEFEAWISSSDTIGIRASDGQQIELSAVDTRRLFAWLDRVGSAMFAAGQGAQAA